MAIALVSAIARHERRVRLLFSNTLGAGAFNTSKYSIASSTGGACSVVEVLAVADDARAAELVLGSNMVPGSVYTLTCTTVPDSGAATYSGTQAFHFGTPKTLYDQEVLVDGSDTSFGEDIVWSGADFTETATGDLATIAGPRNAMMAIVRRCTSDGIPWDPSYGAKPRGYVDGTSPAVGTLRGSMLAQCRADDRVKSVSIEMRFDDNVSDVYFDIVASLDGETSAYTESVKVTTL